MRILTRLAVAAACFMSLTRAAAEDESGATAIEYGLIAACVAVAIITAVSLTGTNLAGVFDVISGAVDVEVPGAPPAPTPDPAPAG